MLDKLHLTGVSHLCLTAHSHIESIWVSDRTLLPVCQSAWLLILSTLSVHVPHRQDTPCGWICLMSLAGHLCLSWLDSQCQCRTPSTWRPGWLTTLASSVLHAVASPTAWLVSGIRLSGPMKFLSMSMKPLTTDSMMTPVCCLCRAWDPIVPNKTEPWRTQGKWPNREGGLGTA